MAKKSERFNNVVRYTVSKEDKAAQRLAESQHNLAQQQQRLNSLAQYQEEYAQRFTQAGQGGMRANQLRDYQAFLNKLKGAVEQQQRIVAVAVADVEEKKKGWLYTRQETRKANLVMDRYRLQELKHENRLEQKDTDERALRGQKPDGHPLK